VKLLLDEMYTGLEDYFEILGWEVETVHEAGIQGAKDREIAEYVHKHNLILVTEDRRHTELASILGAKGIHIDSTTKVQMTDGKLLEKYPELKKGKG